MNDQASEPAIRNNEDESRFEVYIDGRLGELVYRRRAGRLVLVHAEVPAALEGQGIGGRLVVAAVDLAAREGLTVIPSCPFAHEWLVRHPDIASRATIDWGTGPS